MPTGTFQVRCTASKHACGKPRIVGTSWKNFLANLELVIGTVAPNVASGGSPTMRNQDQIIPWTFLIGNVSQVAVTAAHFPNGSHLGLENSKPFFVHSGLWLWVHHHGRLRLQGAIKSDWAWECLAFKAHLDICLGKLVHQHGKDSTL